jgi:signal peptidase I
MTTRSEMRDFAFFLVKLALIVYLARILLVSPFNIPSESMQPRLLIGDYLLVAKWPYGYSRYSIPYAKLPFEGRFLARTPARGDVIVFQAPAAPGEEWIKRVIGLPGDRVQVVNGTVYLNGLAVPRKRIGDFVIPVTPNMIAAADKEHAASPCFTGGFEQKDRWGQRFCRYPRFHETLPNGKAYDVLDLFDSETDNTAVYEVPAGHLFVMGDNRDRSRDSRFAIENGGVGMLPMSNLVGRALVSYYSTDGSAVMLKPWTWFKAARPDRIGEGF